MRSLTMTVRALRVSAREPMTYRIRGGLVALVFIALALAVAMRASLGAPGLSFFRGLITLDFVGVTMLALSSYSMVITEEKQAETLGLLSLAGFRPISILLGKSLGLLAITLQLLAAQVPFAVLAVTLGGVTPHQVWAAYVILGAYAFLVYGIALLASTVCRTDSAAARTTGMAIGAVIVVPLVGRMLLSVLTSRGILGPNGAFARLLARLLETVLSGLEQASVLRDLGAVFATNYAGSLLARCVVWDSGLGLLLVVAAWAVFPQQDHGEGGGRLRSRQAVASVAESKRPRARSSALAWKDFHFVAGGLPGRHKRFVLYGLACVLLLPLVSQPGFRAGDAAVAWGGAIAAFCSVAVVVEAGLAAGRVLRVEVQDKTLQGLALLPARLSSSASEKVRGSMEVIRVPLIYMLAGIVMSVVCTGSFSYVLGALYASTFVGFMYASLLIFVVQLTLYVSLWLRRGSFAAAAGALVLAFLLLSALFSTAGAACLSVLLIPGGLLLGSVGLQIRIAERLRKLAGEG